MNSNNNNHISFKISNYLLNEIFLYLTINKSFYEILEYSLLSKSCFKIFQNLLINYSSIIEIILPFNNLRNYINNNNNNNKKSSSSSLLLLNYKEIEYFNIIININQTKTIIDIIEFKKIENFIKNKCLNVKFINFKHKIRSLIRNIDEIKNSSSISSRNSKKTATVKISFDKVLIEWDYILPISNFEEFQSIRNIKDQDQVSFFPFSFSFIENYNPRKLLIGTINGNFGSNLYNINSILNFKSIDTIKFRNLITPNKFIKKVLLESNIKNITIVLDNSNTTTTTTSKNQEIEEEQEGDIYNLFKNLEIKNNILNKLVIKKLMTNNSSNESTSSFSLLIEKLLNNKSILSSLYSIGLEYFNIDDSKILEALFEFKNLKNLYCSRESLKSIIQHCQDGRSNIEILKYYNYGSSINKDELDSFQSLFSINYKISLKKIIIFYNLPHLKKKYNDSILNKDNINNINIQFQEITQSNLFDF